MKPVVEQYAKDIKFTIVGSMFTLFFNSEEQLLNVDDVNECDFDRFSRFFQFMLEKGMLLPPSQYEANFLCIAHTEKHIDAYVDAVKEFLAQELN